jgi:hypothetical protein
MGTRSPSLLFGRVPSYPIVLFGTFDGRKGGGGPPSGCAKGALMISRYLTRPVRTRLAALRQLIERLQLTLEHPTDLDTCRQMRERLNHLEEELRETEHKDGSR